MIGHHARTRTVIPEKTIPAATVNDPEDGPRIADTARVTAGAKVTGRGRVGVQAVAVGAVTVAEDARLTDHAILAGTASVRGRSTLSGWATVIEKAGLDGDAWVFGRAAIAGNASIGGHAQVFGDAHVDGGAVIGGHSWIHGSAHITGEAWVHGRSQIGGRALICGTAGPLRIGGNIVIGDGADIASATDFETYRLSWGETVTLYRCDNGTVGIGRSATNHGPLIDGRTHLLDPAINDRVRALAEIWSAAAPVRSPGT